MLSACAPSALMNARASATTRSRVRARRRLPAISGGLNHSGCTEPSPAACGVPAMSPSGCQLDREQCSHYSEHCSSGVNSVHASGVLPGPPGRRPGARTRENHMTVMTSWDLFEDLRAAQDEMLRMSTGRGLRPWRNDGASGTSAWAPPVDIRERKDAYVVAAEIPGVRADDVEITFEDGLLTIQG